MTEVYGEIREKIERALRDLDAERQHLERALTHLDGGPPAAEKRRSSAPKPGGKRARRKRGKRAPAGRRREEFLAAVKSKPGISVAKVGKQIGLSKPHSLYPLAKRLVAEKAVIKKGPGYFPKK